MDPARTPRWVWVFMCGCAAVIAAPLVVRLRPAPAVHVWTQEEVTGEVLTHLRVGATKLEVEEFARSHGWGCEWSVTVDTYSKRITRDRDEADMMRATAKADPDTNATFCLLLIYLRFHFDEDDLLSSASVSAPGVSCTGSQPSGPVILGNPVAAR